MAIYLNIAEWADSLFGAERAAQHYFGKSARDLSAAEAERLAAALTYFSRARSIASTMSLRASTASPQPSSFTHLPGSRSL